MKTRTEGAVLPVNVGVVLPYGEKTLSQTSTPILENIEIHLVSAGKTTVYRHRVDWYKD